MKGMYDQFQCQICEKEEESQIHIYECIKIWETRYEEIMKMEIENKNLCQQKYFTKITKYLKVIGKKYE